MLTKILNQNHLLLKKVVASLFFAKQCIVFLSTAEGSHHTILGMQPHEVLPCSADSFHG
jgi:hypothetical protein